MYSVCGVYACVNVVMVFFEDVEEAAVCASMCVCMVCVCDVYACEMNVLMVCFEDVEEAAVCACMRV